MKKLIRPAAAILILALALSLFACSNGRSAMKIGKTSFSEKVYAYYLTCYKQYWLSTFGQSDSESFWSSEYGGVRVDDYLQNVSDTAIKARLVSAFLFDFYKLQISESEETYVGRLLAGLVEAAGGEEALKSEEPFSSLNITKDDLYDILMIDSKAGALQDYLYGDDGVMKVTDQQRENYYQNKYYRFEHFYLMNYDYDLDENGNIKYDEEGHAQVVEISDARFEEKLALANEVLRRAESGEDFNALIDEYSEELSKSKYKNGHYLTVPNDYFAALSDEVTALKIGEYKLFQSELGIHIIHRIELDEGAWNKNSESGDFYNFEELVTEAAFKELTSSYYDRIVINEDVTGKYKISEMPSSPIWQYFM
jgi:foldase protein PrsA